LLDKWVVTTGRVEVGMMRYWRYLSYVMHHKWYVFVECCRLGIPWLGIIHDWHKFLPSEWLPYARFFYTPNGSKKQVRDKTGYYKPDDTGDNAFDRAWFLHQKRAYHHWQSWAFADTNGGLKLVRIPEKYCLEMIADWRGAARAQGFARDSVIEWYEVNKGKMQFHSETRQWLEDALSRL